MSSSFTTPSPPTTGFFPTGPSAPHAFATMQQSPRDQFQMYAALGAPAQGGQKGQASASYSLSKKTSGKK